MPHTRAEWESCRAVRERIAALGGPLEADDLHPCPSDSCYTLTTAMTLNKDDKWVEGPCKRCRAEQASGKSKRRKKRDRTSAQPRLSRVT